MRLRRHTRTGFRPTYHLCVVRRALSESANAPEYIATVPGSGDLSSPMLWTLPAPALPATASVVTQGNGRSGNQLSGCLRPAACIGLLSLLAWTVTSRGPAMNPSSAVQLTHFGPVEGRKPIQVQAPVTGRDPALLPVPLADPKVLSLCSLGHNQLPLLGVLISMASELLGTLVTTLNSGSTSSVTSIFITAPSNRATSLSLSP